MAAIPAHLHYTKDHEWIEFHADGTATVGVTDYAQQSLGDVTFVELPGVGERFGAGERFGVVESVKAASDLYLPVAGEVTAANGALAGDPALVNSDPYGAAWMLRLRPADPSARAGLLDAAAYAAHTA